MLPATEFQGQPIGLDIPAGTPLFKQCMDQAFDLHGVTSCVVSAPRAKPESHRLLNSVGVLALTSSCTLESAVPTDLSVSTADPVAVVHAVGIKDRLRRLARIERYVLDQCATAQIMVAIRHGAGRVVAIGTWKAFLDEIVDGQGQNKELFSNSISWLRHR